MTASPRSPRSLWAGVLLVGALGLVGCGAPDVIGAPGPAVDGPPVDDVTDIPYGDVPPECIDAFPFAFEPADLSLIEQMPPSWPDAPAGATLCLTSSSGTIETAAYASPAPIDEVIAHYESSLANARELHRATGQETGTGYATLSGYIGEVEFIVQERDAGFTVSFAPVETEE